MDLTRTCLALWLSSLAMSAVWAQGAQTDTEDFGERTIAYFYEHFLPDGESSLPSVDDVKKKFQVDDVTKLPGHLKPFGRGLQSSDEFPVVAGFPPVDVFFQEHMVANRPLLMKGAAQLSPAFHLWSDDYMASHPEAAKAKTLAENGKKENRDATPYQSNMATFLRLYNKKNVYMVDSVPWYLRPDILVPCPVQCPLILKNFTTTLNIWFSSGGTKSVVHVDTVDNINCLYRGEKELVFVNPNKHQVHLDRTDGGFSSVDVDSVDYEKYPWAAAAEYLHVNMSAGDCLFIPFGWYHQVRSTGSNLAVNHWFKSFGAFPFHTCNKMCDPKLRADQLFLHQSIRDIFLSSLSPDASLQLEESVDRVLNFFEVFVKTDDMADRPISPSPEEPTPEQFRARVLEIMTKSDNNQDGFVTPDEIKCMFELDMKELYDDWTQTQWKNDPQKDAGSEDAATSESEPGKSQSQHSLQDEL